LDQTREAQDRILTLPNLVTLIRIFLIPIFVYLSWSRSRLILGGLLLGLIGATDWIDGYLARRLNQTSTVGKVIDPSADRVLLIAAGIVSFHDSLIPTWLLIVIFAREIAVSSVVGTVAVKFKRRLDVVYYGKAGTLLMMFGFPFFVFAGADTTLSSVFRVTGYVFLMPGLAILFLALASYSKKLVSLSTSGQG
jgi:cardiolipin synthase